MRFALTGGTGFVGRHVLGRLMRNHEVRVLTRSETAPVDLNAEFIRGDLRDEDAIRRLATGADVLVHLAYPEAVTDTDSERIAAAIADSALRAKIRQVIHASTAVVVGRTDAAVITEETLPRPETPYQRQKLRIEQILTERLGGRIPLCILRPTAIFGPGGRNLVKIADDLRRDRFFLRAARRAFLRSRRLNLVCVDGVAAAIDFAAAADSPLSGCFIVSDDDAPENTFGEVTAVLARSLNVAIPSVPDLTPIVAPLLRLRGRSISNPYAVFAPRKLLDAGFERPVSFIEGLRGFAEWYRSAYIS